MITVSKITHKEMVQILLKFDYNQATISMLKQDCEAKYTNTH
jgi:hypothetical protein